MLKKVQEKDVKDIRAGLKQALKKLNISEEVIKEIYNKFNEFQYKLIKLQEKNPSVDPEYISYRVAHFIINNKKRGSKENISKVYVSGRKSNKVLEKQIKKLIEGLGIAVQEEEGYYLLNSISYFSVPKKLKVKKVSGKVKGRVKEIQEKEKYNITKEMQNQLKKDRLWLRYLLRKLKINEKHIKEIYNKFNEFQYKLIKLQEKYPNISVLYTSQLTRDFIIDHMKGENRKTYIIPKTMDDTLNKKLKKLIEGLGIAVQEKRSYYVLKALQK